MGWFDRDLKLVCEDYFSMYNPLKKRWEIRRNIFRLKHLRLWSSLDQLWFSSFVRSCKHKEPVSDDIYMLRRGLYNARHAREVARKIDEANRNKEISEDAEATYQHRAAAKAVWGHFKEPSVIIHRD
jgi:precorrin isomerase